MEGVAPALGRRQEKNGLLDGRGEVAETQDLSNPGLAYLSGTRQGSTIDDLAGTHELVEAMGQGQQPGHARYPAGASQGQRLLGTDLQNFAGAAAAAGLAPLNDLGPTGAVLVMLQITVNGRTTIHPFFRWILRTGSKSLPLITASTYCPILMVEQCWL